MHDQKYLKTWETEEQFKGWLSPSSKGPNYFYCKSCMSHCKGGKSEINKHANTQEHLTAAKSEKKKKKMVTLFDLPKLKE